MASHHGTSTSTSTTVGEDLNTRSLSSFFRNRFSNASLLSLSSVRTFLPQYSVVDTLEDPDGITDDPESPSYAPSSWSSPTSGPTSPSAIEPPRYSVINPVQVEDPDLQAREFRYSYPIRPKNPWATLHLRTRDTVPGNSKPLQNRPRVPRFWGCDPIRGSLQLDLDNPQNVQQINIVLHGRIILSAHSAGSVQFLDREFTLWDKSMGYPLQFDHTDLTSTQKKKFDGRLAPGKYTFPFSYPFPTHADPISTSSVLNTISPFPLSTVGTVGVTDVVPPTSPGYEHTEKTQRRRTFRSSPVSSNEAPSSPTWTRSIDHEPSTPVSQSRLASSMPQTFLEKDIKPNVAYEISVRILHGRFKTSGRITTNVAYLPALEPLPASRRRQEAYEAGAMVPCPMDDPEGWFALPTAIIHGMAKIKDELLHTKVDCTLYLAQPLSYARGSLIPCFITISSDDVEVMQLFSSAEKPTVRLLRRVRYLTAEVENPSVLHGVASTPSSSSWAPYAAVPTSDMKLVTHEVGRAKWWTASKNIVQGPNVRNLEGEIHLSPDLQPSCDLHSFRIEYAVELLSLRSDNFEHEIDPLVRKWNNVVASNPVEITTLYRQDEPVPTAYSEPPKTYRPRRISSGDKSGMIFEEDK